MYIYIYTFKFELNFFHIRMRECLILFWFYTFLELVEIKHIFNYNGNIIISYNTNINEHFHSLTSQILIKESIQELLGFASLLCFEEIVCY